MWWKGFFAPGIVYFIAGALEAQMAALLIALYLGYQVAVEIVNGRQGPGWPPAEKVVMVGVYIGAVLFAQMFFMLGLYSILVIERPLCRGSPRTVFEDMACKFVAPEGPRAS